MDNKSYYETYTGEIFTVSEIEPKHINLYDLAHHGSHLCRFVGAVKFHYTIAQHQVYAARILWEETSDATLAMCGLVHDGSEIITSDVASPIKRGLTDYIAMENKVQEVIAKKYGLPYPWPHELEVVDKRLLVTEARDLKEPTWMVRHAYKYGEPYSHFVIEEWSSEKAKQEYIKMFEFLMIQRSL